MVKSLKSLSKKGFRRGRKHENAEMHREADLARAREQVAKLKAYGDAKIAAAAATAAAAGAKAGAKRSGALEQGTSPSQPPGGPDRWASMPASSRNNDLDGIDGAVYATGSFPVGGRLPPN
jgi:hypothetical protein